MKKTNGFYVLALLLICSCAGEKKSGAGRPRIVTGGDANAKDTTVYYDAEIGTRQKSYKDELLGHWSITIMHRQQKATPEKLEDVFIEFAADSSIKGKAPCNSFGGMYVLKGTSVRFSRIISTKMSCFRIDQENTLIRLLEDRVSAYSVSGNKLLLRDGSSNIVFECEK